MMNKIRRLILSATILAAAFGALGVLHACAGKTVEKEYTAYYGEIFTLPGISGATYALSDSDGNAVDVSSGNFLPTDLDGYTLRVNEKGKKYSIKINVAERNAPFISVDRKTVYATVGKQTALPVFRATDGVTGKELPVTVQVTSPDGKVEVAGESFVPERAGEYVVTASAAGENGVGAERTAIVMAKEGLNYANVLAPMAEERGTETIADTFGVMPAYNTDENFTYGSEEGSLKLVSNMEGNVYFGFRLKNLVRRIRPCDINDAIRLLIPYPSDYSFPSGHTAVSFAAASALYFAGEKYLWKAALVLAAFIAFSRMYLYVHYPTDILGGALLGILCGYLGCRIVQKTEQYKRKI